MEKAGNRQVSVEIGRGVEKACNQEFKIAFAARELVLCKMFAQSVLGVTDVEKATS